jgi:hypothetical protein
LARSSNAAAAVSPAKLSASDMVGLVSDKKVRLEDSVSSFKSTCRV